MNFFDLNLKKIELKWTDFWFKSYFYKTNLTDSTLEKKYILAMFPYPSGDGLHIGHIRNYTISDVISRFFRLKGFNVFFPMGWDSFGLPAEQYSIKTNNHPLFFTNKNIKKIKDTMIRMGFSFDWTKEISTCESWYYEKTQKIFIKLFQNDLAEYCNQNVFWCEKLGTVLANEEIINKEGKLLSERGEFEVIKKELKQWKLKITNYSHKLLDGLSNLDWPTDVKTLQKKWIGLTTGYIVNFTLDSDSKEKIEVFTTRLELVPGTSAIIINKKYKNLSILVKENIYEINNFIEETETSFNTYKKNEKKAIFTGSYAINSVNNIKIPIFLVNFLEEYGTNSYIVYSVLEEEKENKIINLNSFFNNDYEFQLNKTYFNYLNKNFNIPFYKWLKLVSLENSSNYELIYNYIEFIPEFKDNLNLTLINFLEKKTKSKKTSFYHLKDWVFSRQRYWGEPIPIIHLENGSDIIEKNLPLTLPILEDFKPNSNYISPLDRSIDWKQLTVDGIKGTRDINVMPQWAGSSWYFLAFLLKEENKNSLFNLDSKESINLIKKWLPVDIYIGGKEHANLHLLYSRFWYKFLIDSGEIINDSYEPFKKLICQGVVLGTDGEKMSKSKGNYLSIDRIIEEYGSESFRLAVLFMAPIDKSVSFKEEGVKTFYKWLKKVYVLLCKNKEKIDLNNNSNDIIRNYILFVKKVNIDYSLNKFNLIISHLMSFFNDCSKIIDKGFSIKEEFLLTFLYFLYPLAPSFSCEMSKIFFNKNEKEFRWVNFSDVYNKYKTFDTELIKFTLYINNKRVKIIYINKDEIKTVDEAIFLLKNKGFLDSNLNIYKTFFEINKFINLITVI